MEESQKIFDAGSNIKFPKVAFTPKGKVFLIGGTKDQDQNEVINQVTEVIKKGRKYEGQ